jgi:phosphoribosylglycinamide formyltransferase-1
MTDKARIAVMVSGGGTNLQALIDAQTSGLIEKGEIVLVISNREDAYAIERARKAGIETYVITRKASGGQAGFEEACSELIDSKKIDLVVLAGYLVAIPEMLVKEFPNKIINVHPSLIPSFCGVGYYGLKVHEAALARGVKVTGATVHFVDCGMDTGPIILQKAVEIEEGDTPEVLQRRVMEQAEWIILPKAIDMIANDKITLK